MPKRHQRTEYDKYARDWLISAILDEESQIDRDCATVIDSRLDGISVTCDDRRVRALKRKSTDQLYEIYEGLAD